MNAFQIIIVVALGLLVISTARGASRGLVRKRIAVFWLLVWFSAGITTLWPEVTVLVARKLGVGRGTDLVMYCSVFVMLIGFFYIYTRFRRLDHAITLLVRQLAIERAAPGAIALEAPPRSAGAMQLKDPDKSAG